MYKHQSVHPHDMITFWSHASPSSHPLPSRYLICSQTTRDKTATLFARNHSFIRHTSRPVANIIGYPRDTWSVTWSDVSRDWWQAKPPQTVRHKRFRLSEHKSWYLAPYTEALLSTSSIVSIISCVNCWCSINSKLWKRECETWGGYLTSKTYLPSSKML